MIAKALMASGIALTVIGTVFTLWTVLTTQSKTAGTWGELGSRHITFPQEKKRAILGCVMIVVGGALQIVGLFV